MQLIPDGPRMLPIVSGPLRGRLFCANTRVRPHYHLGCYERRVARVLTEILTPGCVAYDIGANCGYLALVMGLQVRRSGADGHVYAFEPSPTAFRMLAANSLLSRDLPVHVNQLALSDAVGVEAFSSYVFDLVSQLGDHSLQHADAQVIRVRTETPDYRVAEYALEPPDLVKIDVEGAEIRVLKGMASVLASCRPRLLIETHSPELEAEVLSMLSALSYKSRVIGTEVPKQFLFTPS